MPKRTRPCHSICLNASSSPWWPSGSCLRSPKHQLSIATVTRPFSAQMAAYGGCTSVPRHNCSLPRSYWPACQWMNSSPGAGRLAAIGNENQGGHRLETIQVENPALQRVAFMLLLAHQSRRRGLVIPGQVAEQIPQFAAAALLIVAEVLAGLRQRAGQSCAAHGHAAGQCGRTDHQIAAAESRLHACHFLLFRLQLTTSRWRGRGCAPPASQCRQAGTKESNGISRATPFDFDHSP